MPTRLEQIDERLIEIQRSLDAIESKPEPTEEDEAIRAQLIQADQDAADELLDEWKQLTDERDPLVARAARIEEVKKLALKGKREDGDGVRRSPELVKKVEPYSSEAQESLKRTLYEGGQFDIKDTVSRANAAIDSAPEHVDDDAKRRLSDVVNLDNRHGALIARHMLLTGSPEYHKEFMEYVKSRGNLAGKLLRTAMSLTDSAGGYLVPFTLDPTIILTNAGVADPIRQISTIKTIATDTWNGVTSAGVNAEWLAEGVSASDASPTFGNVVITPKKAAAWVFGSYEVLADSGFASELGRLLADAKARLEAAAFATGNSGATQPRGVIAAVAAVTASIVTSATTNAFVVGDVYRVTDALRPRDASQASWLANKRFQSLVRQFDTAGGSAFWANLGMGVPPALLGQPIYENSTMASAVTTGGNVLLAGNFAEYYIVDRVGMSVMYEPMVKSATTGRPTGEAGWFAFWRVGADVVDPAAFRLLQLNQVAAATALA